MRILTSHLYRLTSPLLRSRIRLVRKNGERLSRNQIGDLGERIARHALIAKGRKIFYRNYSSPSGGEVDIVARDGDILSFVEVKTRTYKGYGRPLQAVDSEKQKLIERGANSWLNRLATTENLLWRFDVVEVILTEGERPEVVVVKNAF